MAPKKIRKPVGSLRRRGAERREEQLARTAYFQFSSPPTKPQNAIHWLSAKFGQIFPTPDHAPITATSRDDLLGLRLKSLRPTYRPHQGTRECARRIAA